MKRKQNKIKVISILFLSFLCVGLLAPLIQLFPLAHASSIFSDDFETGNFNAWTGNSGYACTVEVQNTHPYSGAYNAHFNITGQYGGGACWKTFTGTTNCYARAYFKFNMLNIGNNGERVDILMLGNAYNESDATLFEYSSSQKWGIMSYQYGYGYQYFYGTHTPATGVWYCVELERNVTSNLLQLWVNDTLEVTANPTHTLMGASNKMKVSLTPSTTAFRQNELYADSAVVDSSYIPSGIVGTFTLYFRGLPALVNYTVAGTSYVGNSTNNIADGTYTLTVPGNVSYLYIYDFNGYDTGVNTTSRSITISASTILTVYYKLNSAQPYVSSSYQAVLTGSSQAVRLQPKSFYAAGRVWIFYMSGFPYNNGSAWYVSSPDNGASWSAPTKINNVTMMENVGENLAVTLDAAGRCHVIWRQGTYLAWNVGTPQTNGSITWVNPQWIRIASWYGWNADYDFYIALDSSGHDWVTWILANGTGNYLFAYENGNTDGTWSQIRILTVAIGGFFNYPTNNWILPLPSNKMLFGYFAAANSTGICSRLWNGSGLESAQTIASALIFNDYDTGKEGYGRALTVDSNGNVYFAFLSTVVAGNSSLDFALWNYTTGVWSSTSLIKSYMAWGASPCFGWYNNTLVVYYIFDSHRIVSQSYVNKKWSDPLVMINDSGIIPAADYWIGYNARMNSFGEQIGNKVGLVWIENVSSPVNQWSLRYSLVLGPQLTLTIESNSGGVTNPAAGLYLNYTVGNTVHVYEVNSSGSIFDHWIVNGSAGGNSNPLTFVIRGNSLVQPVFALAGKDVVVTFYEHLAPKTSSIQGKELSFSVPDFVHLFVSVVQGKEIGFAENILVHLCANTTIGKEVAISFIATLTALLPIVGSSNMLVQLVSGGSYEELEGLVAFAVMMSFIAFAMSVRKRKRS